jgi:hypothetical protein
VGVTFPPIQVSVNAQLSEPNHRFSAVVLGAALSWAKNTENEPDFLRNISKNQAVHGQLDRGSGVAAELLGTAVLGSAHFPQAMAIACPCRFALKTTKTIDKPKEFLVTWGLKLLNSC